MYRALTWWCTQQGIDLEDLDAVAQAAKDLPLHMETDPRSPSVQVAGVVIDEAIRTTEISASVSKVATNLAVRNELCHRQQALIAESAANSGGVVAEGRDITGYAEPDLAAVRGCSDWAGRQPYPPRRDVKNTAEQGPSKGTGEWVG